MAKKYTERGFRNYAEFVDAYGSTVTIRESSSAMAPHVWIFSNRDGLDGNFHLGEWQAFSPHLTVAQAKKVICALQGFVDDHTPKPTKKKRRSKP